MAELKKLIILRDRCRASFRIRGETKEPSYRDRWDKWTGRTGQLVFQCAVVAVGNSVLPRRRG